MNNFDLCRQNLLNRLGIDDLDKRDPNQMQIEIKKMISALDNIVSLCRPRLIMGGIRYASKWKHNDLMNYMQTKFNLYKKTGNIEYLIDFVNFVAIESNLKTHPKFHFKGEDR